MLSMVVYVCVCMEIGLPPPKNNVSEQDFKAF